MFLMHFLFLVHLNIIMQVVLTLFSGFGVLMGGGGAEENANTGTMSIDSFPTHKVMAGPDFTTLIGCKNIQLAKAFLTTFFKPLGENFCCTR